MKAIMFGAYYCGYCRVIWDKVMDPLIEEGFDIEYIDAMKKPGLAKRYKVKNLPVTVFLDERGCALASIHGEPSQDEVKRLLGGGA